MSQKLAEELRQLRALKGARLRDVEDATEISNAYLSQLENGKAENPSPHWLHKLAEFYDVPYESLMEAAGYLKPTRKKGRKSVSAVGAALMNANLGLTKEEEKAVVDFIGYLRTQRPQQKG